MELFISATPFVVILSIITFVGVAWSHCPKGIVRTLIEQRSDSK